MRPHEEMRLSMVIDYPNTFDRIIGSRPLPCSDAARRFFTFHEKMSCL